MIYIYFILISEDYFDAIILFKISFIIDRELTFKIQ